MKMCKFLFAAALLCCAALAVSAGELIAKWDFQTPDVLKGNYPLTLRGKSLVGKGGLWIPVSGKKERGGAATTAKQPVLGEHFLLTAEFTISGKQEGDDWDGIFN